MKKTLPILIVLLSSLNFSQAQVTQLSNNTNLDFGIPISANKAIFLQGDTDSLWVTDGTAANTVKLNIPVKLDDEFGIALWNNKLYFGGINAANGAELWVTDGTDGGTSMVKDINPGAASSSPRDIIVYNNALYFYATTPDKGAELWKSNGTLGGTEMVKDINDGIPGSYSSNISYYFFKNELYFSAVQSSNGLELWKTNGTTDGTSIVKDINTIGNGSSTPEFLQVFNDELFFTADDGTHGRELFKTNGSSAGTDIVKDIFTGNQGSGISGVILFAGKMLFNARDATGNAELYASDGTTGGTNVLKEINAGAAGSDPDITSGIIINSKLIFAATSAANGRELFVTDGTQGGTVLFKDIISGPVGSNPQIWLDLNLFSDLSNPGISMINQALYNGKIFFSTDFQPGISSGQLWITDGTAPNTVPVKDFGLGGIQGSFGGYFYTQSGLYFGANNSGDISNPDFEIFKSQGTELNTSLYADVNPGPEGSNPFFQFFILNGKVFFVADDGDSEENERDLFVLSGTEAVLPLQLLKFAAAAVTEGVKLDWTTSNERESKEFEMQRSIDGNKFQPIGLVKAGGQNTKEKEYDYFDKDAYYQKSTTLYYRLKIVDNDGRFTYSPVAFIKLGLPVVKGLQLSPNPANKYLRINLNTPSAQNAQIRIINSNGQVVKMLSTRFAAGNNQQIIDLENLSPGMYHAELVIGGKASQSVRFIKE